MRHSANTCAMRAANAARAADGRGKFAQFSRKRTCATRNPASNRNGTHPVDERRTRAPGE